MEVPNGLFAVPNAFVIDNVPYAPDIVKRVAKSEYPAKEAQTSKQAPSMKEFTFLLASVSISLSIWSLKGHRRSTVQGVVKVHVIPIRFKMSAQPGNPK